MPTLIPDPLPAEVAALLARRREWGADHHDEVWEGVLHMSPPPWPRHELLVTQLITLLQPLAKANGMAALSAAGIGVTDDHRVPDLTLLRPPAMQWNATAALAVEVLSWREPADKKLGFYAAHDVEELVIIDPDQRTVRWLELRGGAYEPVQRSGVIDLGPAELADRIDWDPFPVEPEDHQDR
jgi:hypothetical protein